MRILSVLLIFILASCEPPPSGEQPIDHILGVKDSGLFRGLDVGASRNAVAAKEAEHIVHQMPDELTCRIPLDLKDSAFYDITYNFDEEGLRVIELDIFPASNPVKQDLYNNFKAHYDRRFGQSSEDDGFTMWTTRSHRGTAIEVSMVDESAEIGRPYLSVNFYEYNE